MRSDVDLDIAGFGNVSHKQIHAALDARSRAQNLRIHPRLDCYRLEKPGA